MIRPDVLYHGSRVLVPVLEPLEGPINASHDRAIAVPWALGFVPDPRGRTKWSIQITVDGPRITIEQGALDLTAIGYLYRVPVDGFEQVNPMVWVCREPVTPIDYEILQTADFVGWTTTTMTA
jgi:hypothetical protein